VTVSSDGGSASTPNIEVLLCGLANAEATWGADDTRTIQCVRRIACFLEYQGRAAHAIPLWFRILEIEQARLGHMHPDMVAVRARIKAVIETSAMNDEAASAYRLHLQRYDELEEEAAPTSSSLTPCWNMAGMAASLGVNLAAVAGNVAVTSALQVGLSVASSACVLASGAASHAAGAAMSQLAGKTATAATVVPESSWTATVAGLAASGAFRATQAATCSALSAAQTVGVAVSSSTTTSVLSFAGEKAISGTACAASGVWNLARRSFSSEQQQGDISHPHSENGDMHVDRS